MHKIKVMNNNRNTALNGSPNVQRNDKVNCKFQFFSKIINRLSILCSLMGISLFSAIFFELTNILDYRSTKRIAECAHYLVIAAVILFCFATLLSRFKRDANQNSPVIPQSNLSEKAPFENYSTAKNVNAESCKSVPDKLRLTKCENKVKENIMSDNIRPANPSSKTVKDFSKPKQEEINVKTVNRKNQSLNLSEKSLQADKQLVPVVKPHEMLLQKQIVPAVTSPRVDNQHKTSLQKQIVPVVTSPRVPNCWNIMSASASANIPATEVVATRKVTFFSGGIAQSQEEYQIRRTTYFRCPEGGISSPDIFSAKFRHDSDQKIRMFSSMFQDPPKSPVCDVLTKFESLNILH